MCFFILLAAEPPWTSCWRLLPPVGPEVRPLDVPWGIMGLLGMIHWDLLGSLPSFRGLAKTIKHMHVLATIGF